MSSGRVVPTGIVNSGGIVGIQGRGGTRAGAKKECIGYVLY